MKQLLFALLCAPIVALATSSEDIADSYFSKKNIQLTSQELTALSIGKKWQTGTATSKPVAARDGSIAFVYG